MPCRKITAPCLKICSPIICKGRRGLGFHALHFSVNQAFDDGAYIRSIAYPKGGQIPITALLTVRCPGNRTRLARLRVRCVDHYTKRHPAVVYTVYPVVTSPKGSSRVAWDAAMKDLAVAHHFGVTDQNMLQCSPDNHSKS